MGFDIKSSFDDVRRAFNLPNGISDKSRLRSTAILKNGTDSETLLDFRKDKITGIVYNRRK